MDLSDYSPQLFLKLRSYLSPVAERWGSIAFLSWGPQGEDEEAGVKHTAVQFSRSVVSDSLRPHALQHARPPCPSPTPGVHSDSCPSSRWCHPTISSSVIPFSRLQSFPASGSFPMSQFSASGGQSTGVSASASVNIQDWFPLGWTGWISLQSNTGFLAYIFGSGII